MGRTIAVVWHASFSIAAGVLYLFFVLPRWPELLGETSPTLGTVLRIVTGALIGLAALPVVFTLLRTRRPEYGTPQLALTLLTSSIALHVLSGLLIIGTAISEIWLNLDSAGQWLFGIYGAAASIGLLGIATFYLAFAAELPPPPPKPLKPKGEKRRRGRRKATAEVATTEEATEEEATEEVATDATAEEDTESEQKVDGEPADVTAEESEPVTEEATEATPEVGEPASEVETPADDAPSGGLRNRRPSGKTSSPRRRRRLRGGVAVED
jgi:hypothetical protein